MQRGEIGLNPSVINHKSHSILGKQLFIKKAFYCIKVFNAISRIYNLLLYVVFSTFDMRVLCFKLLHRLIVSTNGSISVGNLFRYSFTRIFFPAIPCFISKAVSASETKNPGVLTSQLLYSLFNILSLH